MRYAAPLLMLLITGALARPAWVAAGEGVAEAGAKPPADVTVNFIAPEKFADATYENRTGTREKVTRDIAAQFVKFGQRHLAPGQRLEIEVLDVDLAGRYEPWQSEARDVRFMRDVTWPRINFKYRLLGPEGEIASGEENLSDMQYLRRPGVGLSQDRLRYESSMLEGWFSKRFKPAV